jgi:hypothetical protein
MMIKFMAVRAGAVLTGGAVLMAFSLCTVAHAKAPPQLATLKATAASFATLDRNADNQLSRTEAGIDRKLADVFAYVDINGDGFISRDEYLALNEESPDAG